MTNDTTHHTMAANPPGNDAPVTIAIQSLYHGEHETFVITPAGGPTFEDYLRANLGRSDPFVVFDHSLRAQFEPDGSVSFYVHPAGRDGDTPTFVVHGNILVTKSCARMNPASQETV